jgi:hypothetical protein
MSQMRKCPRCEEKAYQRFSTHSYCSSCNYSPDYESRYGLPKDSAPIPSWVDKALADTNGQKTVSSVSLLPSLKKPGGRAGVA